MSDDPSVMPRYYTSSILTKIFAILFALMLLVLIWGFRYSDGAELTKNQWLHIFYSLVFGLMAYIVIINIVIRFRVRFTIDSDSLTDVHTRTSILIDEIDSIRYHRPHKSLFTIYQATDKKGVTISFLSNTLLNGRPFSETIIAALQKLRPDLEPQKSNLVSPTNKPKEQIIAVIGGIALSIFMLSPKSDISFDFSFAPDGANSLIEIEDEVIPREYKEVHYRIAVSAKMRAKLSDAYELKSKANDFVLINIFVRAKATGNDFDFKITAKNDLEYYCYANTMSPVVRAVLKKDTSLTRCPKQHERVHFLGLAPVGTAKKLGWLNPEPHSLLPAERNFIWLAQDNLEYENKENLKQNQK